jgi:3-hydroxyisobutyrate dehydrogenase-like beta-hydroxyacid dehydrogenase
MIIGFIGIGTMGARMASRLLRQGEHVVVYDTNHTARSQMETLGAEVAHSAKDVGDRADAVCISLPTPQIVKACLLGVDGLAQGKRVQYVIEFSTIGPQVAAEIAQQLDVVGKSYIDAPVSGGVAGAEKGTLAVMVSGQAPAVEAVQSILATMGKVFYVGSEAGQAQAVKLANNLLSMTALAVTSEAMVMGASLGINPQVMLDAINAGSGRNSATQDKFPRAVLPGTFDFGFTTGLAYKDVKLCVEEAEKLGVPMFVGSAVRELYHVTQATQGSASDFTAVCRLLEGWAGSSVRG